MNRVLNYRDFWKILTRAHRWAGLILGAQILLWFLSGFFMSLFPIDDVRGRHIASHERVELSAQDLIPIEMAMTLYTGQLEGARVIATPIGPAYVLLGDAGSQLIDAISGEAWQGVGEANVRQTAKRYYKGEGELVSLIKLNEAPLEYRGALPVWQVEFNDRAKTRLYLDAQTAELKAIRTRLWRVFDFMWMLHIMDYKSRDNFNSWWLKLFSGAAVLFALSGLALVAQRMWLRPKRVRFNR